MSVLKYSARCTSIERDSIKWKSFESVLMASAYPFPSLSAAWTCC